MPPRLKIRYEVLMETRLRASRFRMAMQQIDRRKLSLVRLVFVRDQGRHRTMEYHAAYTIISFTYLFYIARIVYSMPCQWTVTLKGSLLYIVT